MTVPVMTVPCPRTQKQWSTDNTNVPWLSLTGRWQHEDIEFTRSVSPILLISSSNSVEGDVLYTQHQALTVTYLLLTLSLHTWFFSVPCLTYIECPWTLKTSRLYLVIIIMYSQFWWAAWFSGRTSVSGQRSFTVLRSTCSWRVTNQANSTFHPLGMDKWVVSCN